MRGRAHIELREHLVALPAELGARAARRVVIAGVHDPRVPLRRALAHVVRRLHHEHRSGCLAQLTSDRRANAARTDDDDVVGAVRLRGAVARDRARARRRRRLLVRPTLDVELFVALAERHPVTANIGSALTMDLTLGDAGHHGGLDRAPPAPKTAQLEGERRRDEPDHHRDGDNDNARFDRALSRDYIDVWGGAVRTSPLPNMTCTPTPNMT